MSGSLEQKFGENIIWRVNTIKMPLLILNERWYMSDWPTYRSCIRLRLYIAGKVTSPIIILPLPSLNLSTLLEACVVKSTTAVGLTYISIFMSRRRKCDEMQMSRKLFAWIFRETRVETRNFAYLDYQERVWKKGNYQSLNRAINVRFGKFLVNKPRWFSDFEGGGIETYLSWSFAV